MKNNVIFISGIGTNVGKSYATGWLANRLIAEGNNVITQKMIQTGNQINSEDIDVHRRIMGIDYNDDDKAHITAPMIFSFPASPHLAAKIDNRNIDLKVIDNATACLSERYDIVLLEGAGGLMVPITEDYLTIDYIAEHNYPVALVTNGTLGSINHTILSFEALKNRNIDIKYVIYNSYFDQDELISADTVSFLKKFFEKKSANTEYLVMQSLSL